MGRDEARLAALTAELGASYAVADATKSEQVESSIVQAAETFGGLYGIANCFGSLILKPAHLTTDEELESTLAVNLKSAFAVTRAAGRLIKTGGSIVFVSSAAARLGMANHEADRRCQGWSPGVGTGRGRQLCAAQPALQLCSARD